LNSPHQKRISFRHLLAVLSNWLIIAASISASLYTQNALVTVLALVLIGARQHALVVMMHEAAHVQFAGNKNLNDWLSNLFCAFPLFLETDVYRKVHLAHHRHLNTPQDPDLLRKQRQSGWNLPASRRQVAMFIPAFIFALGPKEMASLLWGFSGFGDRKRWTAEPRFMLIKTSYYAAIAALAYSFGAAGALAFYWFIPLLFVLPFVARVRNLSEHSVLTLENDNNASREVVPGWIERFLLAPHHVHYHLTHHHYPHIPFYRLRETHLELRSSGKYDDAHINTSYFFPYNNSVLADVIHGPHHKNLALEKKSERKSGKEAA